MSKIRPYYSIADAEYSKPKLFKPIIEGFSEIDNYKKVLNLLDELCESEKFFNSYNCLLIINEYRSINYSDSKLRDKAKMTWSFINDDSFKNSWHGGPKMAIKGKKRDSLDFTLISNEMKIINNWSLPLDFFIENK